MTGDVAVWWVLCYDIGVCLYLAQDGSNPCEREEEIHCSVAWKKKEGWRKRRRIDKGSDKMDAVTWIRLKHFIMHRSKGKQPCYTHYDTAHTSGYLSYRAFYRS
jgi:hypothetical protein